MKTVHDILKQLHSIAANTREQGDLFERLIVAFLQNDPQYTQLFSNVWRWMEWPGRGGKIDTGIDLVAEEAGSGDLWAIQCKFYQQPVQKSDLDSFFTESGKHPFRHRMIVATAPFSKHAQAACDDQQIQVSTLGLDQLEQSTVDWEKFSWKHPDVLPSSDKKNPRPYQRKAIQDVLNGFQQHDRGKLIMACGTGKTLTSLRLMEEMVAPQGLVLFLVPSIALLSQTLREWTAQAYDPIHCFAVCSDSKVGRDEEDMRISELAYPPTTSAEALVANFNSIASDKFTVVFSTYQSINVLGEAQTLGLPQFDLVICDEAHRTTGVVQDEGASHFLKVHDDNFLKASKRLYMTATPRIYAEQSKSKAKNAGAILYSMDDAKVYGPEFHRLNFSEAVESRILSDYKVIILAVDEQYVLTHLGKSIHDGDVDGSLDDVAKIVGCWNALSKRFPDDDPDRYLDSGVMRRAVAFTTTISNSKRVRDLFKQTVNDYVEATGLSSGNLLRCEVEHVDGTQNVAERNQKLNWLKHVEDPSSCHILTNARCLTEGVDVPSLDAVMFLNPRNSAVDVVQAVGRVMRRTDEKQYGYVILPIAVPSNQSPEQALNDNKRYRVVWDVLNALRAHDDRFNDIVNKLELNKKKPPQIKVIGIGGRGKDTGKDDSESDSDGKNVQSDFLHMIDEWRNAIYAKIVEKCGERRYWERWAQDVADIAERHRTHIHAILNSGDDKGRKAQRAFNAFLKGLHVNLNNKITQDEAIEMLAQHLITKPVFDALFEDYEFSAHNPVSRSMQKVLQTLEEHALWKETEKLERFYESVRKRASNIDNAAGKQKIIAELYDTFFRTAFKKMAERLGIVFTPVDVVDFILNSVEHILHKEFGVHVSDEGVHVLDPFTGTGTFIVRLLQSGLIRSEDLMRKYREELHANEIVLLAYYIAAINIEETYHRLLGQDYEPFPGIVLTDTFQLGENEGTLMESMFPENNERISIQKQREITVIVGNPPYKNGQRRENDNNRSLKYRWLDQRIKDTYVAASNNISTRNMLYDSYIRAIRWASDRVGDCGIVAFVTNGSFIDGHTADGLRKCLAEEFTSIYCFNLRGDATTSGEQRQKESGNVFGEGSRLPVAISILVKNPKKKGPNEINYWDIGDYLSRDRKLEIIRQLQHVEAVEWEPIHPNEAYDWIEQRGDVFEKFVPMRAVEGDGKALFVMDSSGIKTNRDPWTYNFSAQELQGNMQSMIDFYNQQVNGFVSLGKARPTIEDVESYVDNDSRKISWSKPLKQDVRKGKHHSFEEDAVVLSLYRPFCKQHLYLNKSFVHSAYSIPNLFPESGMENLAIAITGIGATKPFSALIVDSIPNYHFHDTGLFFPLFYYEKALSPDVLPGRDFFGDDNRYVRRDGLTDWSIQEFRRAYSETISKEDIFFYVYGILHSPDYRQSFDMDLKKMLPRIPLVQTEGDFWVFSQAGRQLANLHLNYETVDPWSVQELHQGDSADPEFYRVEKMQFAKVGREADKTAIKYNKHITLTGIPLEAYRFVVNGTSAIEWVMERYRVTQDKDSGISNDANMSSKDPRYIIDLIKRIVRVSIETQQIVESLPKLRFA